MAQLYSLSPQAQKRIKDKIAAACKNKKQSQEEYKQQKCWEATELILKRNSASYRNGEGLNSQEFQSLIRKGILILPKEVIGVFSRDRHFTIRKIQDLIQYDGLRAKGTSDSTLKRFLKGDNVDEISFKAFCKVLQEDPKKAAINQPVTAKFKPALLKLNHTEQGQTFDRFTTTRSPRCPVPLLIDNCFPDSIRLKWLIWYLLDDALTGCQDEDFVFFDLAGSLNWDINNLWHRLKEKFGSAKDNEPVRIAKSLAKKLQKQHIVLVFYGVDNVDNFYLDNLVKLFWQPLLKAMEETTQTGYLLMCWVNRGQADNNWRESIDKNRDICQL